MSDDPFEALRRAAESSEKAEEAFRRESRTRLEALEKARVAAYRRYHLLKGMKEAAASSASLEEGRGRALDFALSEAGWREEDAGFGELRDRLAAAADAVVAGSSGGKDAIAAFALFEAWYGERFGSDFLDLLERERGFFPVVDF